MKTILFTLVIFLTMSSSYPDPLAKRRLLLFGNTAHPAMVEQQLKWLNADKKGMNERDLAVIIVQPKDQYWDDYRVPRNAFAVVLIGKDGGEKYRTDTLLSTTGLFSIIDAMPMRQAEMKRGK